MARLKITRVNGDVSEYAITPSIEYAYEIWAKKGFGKSFTDDPSQTSIYWLAWKCISKEEDVPLFGEKFVDTLTRVEVLDDSDPNS